MRGEGRGLKCVGVVVVVVECRGGGEILFVRVPDEHEHVLQCVYRTQSV